MNAGTSSLSGRLETVLLMRPAALSLLAMCLVLLWICLRERGFWPAVRMGRAAGQETASVERV